VAVGDAVRRRLAAGGPLPLDHHAAQAQGVACFGERLSIVSLRPEPPMYTQRTTFSLVYTSYKISGGDVTGVEA
jgi:hypothetical protein